MSAVPQTVAADPTTNAVGGVIAAAEGAIETPVQTAAENLVKRVTTDPAVLLTVDSIVKDTFTLAGQLLAPLAVRGVAALLSKFTPAAK